MPEGPEVTILSQYLLTKLQNRSISNLTILSGKYLKKKINNQELLENNTYIVKNIDSKGKLLWFELENNDQKIFLTSHLGLTGFWSFHEDKSDRLRFQVGDKYLCYKDDRNFGNIAIYTNKEELIKKLNKLSPDALKTDYTIDQFVSWYNNYAKKRENANIMLTLMKQDAIISGLGNYLSAEILYDSKISPHRVLKSLNQDEIKKLAHSIQYITKLSYYNNNTGYMTHFDTFIQTHKERIDNNVYPDYHKHIKLTHNDKFQFKVYRQKKDPYGNDIEIDKTIQNNRSTYWCPAIQK